MIRQLRYVWWLLFPLAALFVANNWLGEYNADERNHIRRFQKIEDF